MVTLTNTELAARTTNEAGLVSFESINMPETLNISVTTEGGETYTFNDVEITDGITNDLEFGVG